MSCKNNIKYIEGICSESCCNKLYKSIKDRRTDIETLSIRQFNCPSCAQVEKPFCSIPVWFTQSCDGMKCFNCPPKCLVSNSNCYHSINVNEEMKQNSNQ